MAAVASSVQHCTPSRGLWGRTGSKQMLESYDKSPSASPAPSPPTSRRNSLSSVNSAQSEPAWRASRHEPQSNERRRSRDRQESNASQESARTTAPQKRNGLKGLFSKKDSVEKDKKKKETERIIIGSKYAAAAKTKMMLDPNYREFQAKHKKPDVKTAGITNGVKSTHSSAAQQEARHPHSGPPQLHAELHLPGLTKIESHDDPDDMDQWERLRKDWNDAPEHNLGDIDEIRSRAVSRQTSPWASPMGSREPSPNRLGSTLMPRSAYGSKRSSFTAAYQKDPTSGRWKKTPPSMTPCGNGAITPVNPQPGDMHPDLLAKSLAERLNTHS